MMKNSKEVFDFFSACRYVCEIVKLREQVIPRVIQYDSYLLFVSMIGTQNHENPLFRCKQAHLVRRDDNMFTYWIRFSLTYLITSLLMRIVPRAIFLESDMVVGYHHCRHPQFERFKETESRINRHVPSEKRLGKFRNNVCFYLQ